MNLRIKPGILAGSTEDHWHSIVDLAHQIVGRGGHDGKRVAFGRRTGTPGVPNARDAHDGFVAKVDFKRTLSIALPLPFVESAERHDAPLANDKITIESALEDGLALCVDR